MTSRADLIDIPERRSVPITEFEVRESGGVAHVEGYASIFDKGYEISGGPSAGGYTEYVNRGAFKTTLAAKPDVVLLENHAGGPLARTKSGTLRLGADSTGLLSAFDLDLRDPQAKSVFIKLDRGDYNEMSFAFRVKRNTWSDNDTTRHLDEVSLHKGDVSIVNFGANPHTSVGLRSVVKMLADEDFSPRELAELRAMSEEVDRAVAALRRAAETPVARTLAPVVTMGSQFARQIHDLSVSYGANCDPMLGDPLEPVRALSPTLDYQPGLEDGDVFDQGDQDSLSQAVHDLVAAAAGCAVLGLDDDSRCDSGRKQLTLAGAAQAMTGVGSLSLAQAARLRLPEDAPNPLTFAELEQLVS